MTTRVIGIRILDLLLLQAMCISFVLCQAITAQGATYYVATTGSDSNAGTSTSPWRNPQKCAATPIKAGDTCIVRSGTYSAPSGKTLVIYVSGSSPSGTSSAPITIKSESPLKAVLALPNTSSSLNAAIYLGRPYYVIEGFDITGGTYSGSAVGYAGIYFTSTGTGSIARANAIHHIGRSVCSNSGYGFSGIFLDRTSSALIERNRIYSIGRRRNGESGCSTTKFHHDHGVYSSGASNLTIRRNVIYDTNRGYPLHFFKSGGGTHSNVFVYHNTISGKSPTGIPAGQIALANTLSNVQIKNNTFYDPPQGYVLSYSPGSTASSLALSYNLTNSTRSDMQNPTSKPPSGISYTNNIVNTNPAFISASTNDYRLTSSSPTINRGTTSGIPTVPDGRPDVSAYEYATQNTLSSPLTPTGVK